MTSQEIAERIETRLEEMGKTKVWFSENSGISRATLHLWKNNKAFPTKEYLEKVKNTLGIEFAVFEVVNGKPIPQKGDGLTDAQKKWIDLAQKMTDKQLIKLLTIVEQIMEVDEG